MMALPHLKPSIYTTRKNIYEAAIVHRRVKEDGFRNTWNTHRKYFDEENVKATKQRAWESELSFNHSMEAWKKEQEKDQKSIQLNKRKVKLLTMLENETKKYAAELSGMSGDNYSRLEEMKEQAETIRTAREEKRKQIAEDLLYQHWRTNTPDIRTLESKMHQKHVISEWSGQIDDRKMREAEERARKQQEDREMEQQRLRALEFEREEEEDRLEDAQKLKRVLKEQMHELREREEEAIFLKRKQDELLKEQWELDEMEEQRHLVEMERKKEEHKRVLLRQHTAALRRKSQIVQQELEEDKKFLQLLLKRDQEEQRVKSARVEKAKADAEWMKSVIEEQMKLEKQREADLDMLYRDEAARVWEKREEEWSKERQARERLMKEVLDERRRQVAERMTVLKDEQEESLERREELLRELEFAQQMTRREKEEEEEAKERRKADLESQITSRVQREHESRSRLEEELEEEKRAEKDYEEMLRQEAQRMNLQGFKPRDHPRPSARTARRSAWD